MTPTVSIVITAYQPEAKRYLDLCMKSVDNLNYPKESLDVIIVGRKDYLPEFPGVRTICPDLDSFYPPVGLNYGISHSKGDYIFMLNDDTIVTKNSLGNMMKTLTINPSLGALMPISNDVQGRYCAGVGIPPGPYEYDQLAPQLNALMNINSIYQQSLFFYDELCLYAVLVKKSVHDEVGGFNERLRFNDDIDYSRRLRTKGYLNAITTDAIVYHFGGVSTKGRLSEQERKESLDIFNAEWSNR